MWQSAGRVSTCPVSRKARPPGDCLVGPPQGISKAIPHLLAYGVVVGHALGEHGTNHSAQWPQAGWQIDQLLERVCDFPRIVQLAIGLRNGGLGDSVRRSSNAPAPTRVAHSSV
jgi:hypothetical protein